MYDTNSDDAKKDIKYVSHKMTAEEADRKPRSMPKQLNKRFLLAVIVVVFGGAFIFTFLAPAKSTKKSSEDKPVAQKGHLSDYAALAVKEPEEKNIEFEGEPQPVMKKEKEVEIPPVIPPVVQAPVQTTSQNYQPLNIPDTRNDRLQSKSISGIKGLTSTQASYSSPSIQGYDTSDGTIDYIGSQARAGAMQAINRTGYSGSYGSGAAANIASNPYSSKSEILNTYANAYGKATAGNNDYNNQNDQSGKMDYFNKGKASGSISASDGVYLPDNSIWQGTIIEAVLTSSLNTDLPGEITARVSKNVYSSKDGKYLLIPQNSMLYGTYNSSISYSQSRVQCGWHTLIRPDGYSINLGNMNGTDAKGASGLFGFINDHPLGYLKAIGLMSVFSIINTEFSKQMKNTDNEYIQQLLANSQEVTVEFGDKLIDRAMNVQPTIKINAGTRINVVANQTVTLPPLDPVPVTQQYRRY